MRHSRVQVSPFLRVLPFLFPVLLLLAVALPGPAAAQEAAGPAAAEVSAETAEDLRALVETLRDEPRREELITQLEAMIAAAGPQEAPPPAVSLGAELLGDVSDAIGEATRQIGRLGDVAANLPALGDWLAGVATQPGARAAVVRGVGRVAAVVAAALAGLWLARLILSRARRRLQVRETVPRWYERVFLSLGLAVVEVAPVAALLAAGYGVMPLLNMQPGGRMTAVLVLTGLSVVSLILIAGRLVLAPSAPTLRWVRLSDERAVVLYRWLRRLAVVGVVGFLAAQAAAAFGLSQGGYILVTRVVGLVLAIMLILLIIQHKAPVAAWIRSRRMVVSEEAALAEEAAVAGEPAPAPTPQSAPEATEAAAPPPGSMGRRGGGRRGPARGRGGAVGRILRDRLADIWPVLAILYVLATYMVWALEVEGGFLYLIRGTALTVVVAVVAFGVTGVLSAGIARLFHFDEATRGRFPGIEKRARLYLPAVQTGMRALVFIIATAALLQVWGVGVWSALRSDSGGAFIGSLVTIVAILLVSFGLWELASSRIERYLSATDAEGNVVERSARAKTLLPLLRNILLVAMVILVGMVVLSELGVNIAPLIAGAGVIGLAVGFGAQKLVQDIITGAFILFENTISVGDVVSVGGHAGLVEGMNVRTIRLRDLSGTVHTIPFSTVDKISNLTKDFSYYVLDVGVAYREDTDQVVKVCEEIVEEMRRDPVYGKEILEPLEVLGVDRFADSAVIVKSRIKTKPIQQWFVGREFNRRMKKRFDELGIEIPFPHQTLYFGEDKAGSAPPARVLVERFENRPPPPGNGSGPAPAPAGPSDMPDPDVV